MLIIDCIYDIVFRRMDVEASNAAPTQTLRSDPRSGSFTRAAEELFLTQPTVSQIKQLTKAVGLPLFEQVGKRLYLTDAGQEVLRVCQIFPRLSQLKWLWQILKVSSRVLRLVRSQPLNILCRVCSVHFVTLSRHQHFSASHEPAARPGTSKRKSGRPVYSRTTTSKSWYHASGFRKSLSRDCTYNHPLAQRKYSHSALPKSHLLCVSLGQVPGWQWNVSSMRTGLQSKLRWKLVVMRRSSRQLWEEGYQYCPGMFGTGSTKGPLTILDVEAFQSNAIGM